MLLSAALFAPALAAALTLRCDDPASLQHSLVPGADEITLELLPAPGSSAVLRIEENGRDLEWRHSASEDFRPIAARPPRLGLLALKIETAQTLQLRAAGGGMAALLQLQCSPADADHALVACTADGAATVPEPADGLCRALAVHAQAYAASRDNRPADSAALYGRASVLWGERGDVARQAAALLGVGEQSIRRARYHDAWAAAQQSRTLALTAYSGYYAARASTQQCLVLQYLGRTDEAWRCMQQLPALYQSLGEISEAANAWYTIAAFALENGKPLEVETALRESARLDQAQVSALVRGRLHYLRARLATEAGQIDAAVDALRQAIAVFDKGSDKRTQGNTYLRAAELYFQLGSLAEADDFATVAIARLTESDAKARLGSAYLVQARIAAARGDEALRRTALARAQQLLDKAETAVPAIEAAAWAASIDPDPAAQAALDQRVARLPRLPPRSRLALVLAAAQRAALLQDWPAVDAALARLPRRGLDISMQWQRDQLRAQQLTATQRAAEALALLESSVAGLRQIAAASRAPALRHIAARRLLQLRGAWIDAYASLAPAQRPGADALWQLLQATQPTALLRADTSAAAADEAAVLRADRALAAELLPDSEREKPPLLAQKALLDLYAAAASPAAATAGPALAQVQAGLGEGELLLAVALGSQRAFALSVSRSGSAVHELPGTQPIRSALAQWLAGISDAQTPLAQIERDATAFGQVFIPANLPRPRARLLLLADESLAEVPLAALRWPGENTFLVEQVASSFVATAQPPPPLPQPSGISVLTATLEGSAYAELPALAGASQEARLLRQALPPAWAARLSEAPLDRGSLRQQLATSGQWLHIAAHGALRNPRQGYSGLWFSTAGKAPEFIGWTDLVGRPLQASLLVLNACELGASGPAPGGSGASFAAALSNAGVAHVVAGLWKVSDSAGAVWIPVFYREQVQSPSSGPAQALRSAQLRLMQSRSFRHPYFWAAYVHLQR